MKKKTALICLLTALSATTIAVAVGCAQEEHNHSYTWKSDSEQCWMQCSCGDKKSAEAHDDADNDGACDRCRLENNSVTFDMNEHGTQVAAQVVYLNGKAKLPDEPEEDGWVFGGWFTDEDCTDGNEYDFDTVVTDDITLYACWTKDSRVKVTFDMKGHGAAVKEQLVKIGEKAVEPETEPVDPNHEYVFKGWFTDTDCTDGNEFDFENTEITEETTIYAKWVPDIRPLVTFDLDEKGDNTSLNKRVDLGSKIEKPDDPEVYHYFFEGWFTDEDCTDGNEFDFENTEINEDTTIYAKLTYDRRVYVTFNVLGHGTAPAMQKVESGDTIEVPEDPSEDGYVFGGWYYSEAFEDYFGEFYDDDEMTGDTTLYAKWMVTVSFHLDDGEPDTLNVKVGDVIPAQRLVPASKEDFDFGGWYTDKGCNDGDEFDSATPINVKTDIYAKWVPAMPKLELGGFKLYSFGSENTLQFSFTAPSAARYKIEPYNPKTFECYFTTDKDEAGVYYGEGYEENAKFIRMSAGQKIIVTLYRGENITDTDKVSLTVVEVEDDFPESWVSGTYTNGQITIELDIENKTVKWDGVTSSMRYYSGTPGKAIVNFNNYNCEIIKVASQKDTFTFQYAADSSRSKVTVSRVEKQERLSVDKFAGVYEPVNASGQSTAKLGNVAKVTIYESGNGFITIGSTNETYKLGESGASYSYDGVTNVLQYQNYRITVNLNEGGNVVSISISNPTITNGSTPVVYTRTSNAPDEPPVKLPLPDDAELIGTKYTISGGELGLNTSAFSYAITITAYDKTTGVYTITSDRKTYTLEIEGDGDNLVVKLYNAAHTTLEDTLQIKVVQSDELKMDGTNNVVTPDMVSNNFVTYTIPKTGIYTVKVINAPSYNWSAAGQTHTSYYATTFYSDYENDPYNYFAYLDELNTPSNKVVLQQGNKFAVNVAEYPMGFESMTFILEESQPDPGTTPESAVVINGVGNKTFAVTSDADYYVKFTAADSDTYHITLSYNNWGSTDYNIEYKVDGVQNGRVEPDWNLVWTYSYYKDGEQVDGDAFLAAPYATVTVTAGQEVLIILKGHSNYENVTVTVEKV